MREEPFTQARWRRATLGAWSRLAASGEVHCCVTRWQGRWVRVCEYQILSCV